MKIDFISQKREIVLFLPSNAIPETAIIRGNTIVPSSQKQPKITDNTFVYFTITQWSTLKFVMILL